MLRGFRRVIVALAELKKRTSLFGILAVAAALATYYAFANAGYVPFAQVCTKGDYGPPDQCAYYDFVSALIGRAFVFLDQHNGMVAAGAGLAVAAFTYFLWASTEKLWVASVNATTHSGNATEAMLDANKLARNEFLASHRPRIILREAIIGSVLEGETIGVIFSLANVGESVGTIVRSSVAIEIVTESVERVFLHGSVEPESHLGTVQLGPGVQMIFNYPHPNSPVWSNAEFGRRPELPEGRLRTIHFTGQILYVDGLGVHRRTAFRRYLRPERQRFYRLPDDYEPDLDYAD